jgi:hypothetical protein
LPQTSKVVVRGQAVAVFTWHGARLLVEGEPDFVCVSCGEELLGGGGVWEQRLRCAGGMLAA